MKKLIILILSVMMIFSLCACSKEPVIENDEIITPIEQPEEPVIENEEAIKPIEQPEEKNIPEEEPAKEEPVRTDSREDFAKSLLENLDAVTDDKKLVLSGSSGTKRIELIENFIASVEKNEAARVFGIMQGYTMPYYFELTYEPDGVIELYQYSFHGSFSGEIIRVYDTEYFYLFSGRKGTSFSVVKTTLFYDEKPECSEEEISKMSVTPEEAKEEARKILLAGNGYGNYLSEINAEKAIGSYGSVIPDDYSDKAEEYYISHVPKYEGTFLIDGKPHHLVRFHEKGDDTNIGFSYYVSAEDKNKVFSVSEVDGSLRPIAYMPEPRIIFKR